MPREATDAMTLEVQGVEIPKLGLGTWQMTGRACREAVRDALELGYRHIDTARMYANEAEVGRGLADSGIDRREVFVTTKLVPQNLRAPEVRRQLSGSLAELRTDYVDLLLIHWPSTNGVPLAETLGAMRELQEQGVVRHLGVSNFPARMAREALEIAPIICDQVEYHPYLGQPALLELAREALEIAPIICDQVEYHPYLGQPALLELARERDLMITAYSPLAQGAAMREPLLREIGQAHSKTPAQVVLRWLLDQPHVSAVPKASSHEHRAANLDVDFELSDEERGAIDGLQRGGRTIDPAWAPEWD